jgi:hypothetical protein
MDVNLQNQAHSRDYAGSISYAEYCLLWGGASSKVAADILSYKTEGLGFESGWDKLIFFQFN